MITARRLAAVLGFLGVALGAFGAHGLRGHLADLDPAFAARAMEWWKTGVLYHLVHAVAALFASAGTGTGTRRPSAAAWAFAIGILLFSGSLYAMALGAPTWLGAVTPVGGLAFLTGWVFLAKTRD